MTNQKKSIGTWLKMLPSEIKKLALQNTKTQDLRKMANSKSDALSRAFFHVESIQGGNFWAEIVRELKAKGE